MTVRRYTRQELMDMEPATRGALILNARTLRGYTRKQCRALPGVGGNVDSTIENWEAGKWPQPRSTHRYFALLSHLQLLAEEEHLAETTELPEYDVLALFTELLSRDNPLHGLSMTITLRQLTDFFSFCSKSGLEPNADLLIGFLRSTLHNTENP